MSECNVYGPRIPKEYIFKIPKINGMNKEVEFNAKFSEKINTDDIQFIFQIDEFNKELISTLETISNNKNFQSESLEIIEKLYKRNYVFDSWRIEQTEMHYVFRLISTDFSEK